MTDFISYQLRKAEKDAAYNNYNYASQKLENSKIMERLAELKSQHEPLHTLSEGNEFLRKKLYAAAFYVATGRMPE